MHNVIIQNITEPVIFRNKSSGTVSTDTARNSAVINTVRNTAFKYNVSNPEITERNSMQALSKTFWNVFCLRCKELYFV